MQDIGEFRMPALRVRMRHHRHHPGFFLAGVEKRRELQDPVGKSIVERQETVVFHAAQIHARHEVRMAGLQHENTVTGVRHKRICVFVAVLHIGPHIALVHSLR